ncbi:hypothetical protein BHE74_00044123 [Ensete ventricosum]|nr:hypothetical protein BHE74_00044123 [Ensete ventricosum]
MGDLILWKAEISDLGHTRGKLAPRWEGPYRVTPVIRDGTYTLSTMEGKIVPWTWHLLLGGVAIVKGLVEVHLDIGIIRTLGEGVLLDHYPGVLSPKSFEHHSVPILVANPPHLLEA